jgi:hypothetical protein
MIAGIEAGFPCVVGLMRDMFTVATRVFGMLSLLSGSFRYFLVILIGIQHISRLVRSRQVDEMCDTSMSLERGRLFLKAHCEARKDMWLTL